MDGVDLVECENGRECLLGVIIQSDLKWTAQIEALCGKLKIRLAGIEKVRRVMSSSAKKIIIEGVFISVLSYCLPVFGGCNVAEIMSLQILQNRAARIALNLPPRSNRNGMFDTLGWLTVKQLIVYYSLVAIFRIRSSGQPCYLAKVLLNENHNGHIIVKNNGLQLYRNSFMFRGPIQWNMLPISIRREGKLKNFKINLSKWIMENIERFED